MATFGLNHVGSNHCNRLMATARNSKRTPGVLPEVSEQIVPARENYGELVLAAMRFENFAHEEITVRILTDDWHYGPYGDHLQNIANQNGWYLHRMGIVMPRSEFHKLGLVGA